MRTKAYRAACMSLTLFLITLYAAYAAPSGKPATAKPDGKKILQGQQLFESVCAQCHGASGEGGEGPSLRGLRLDQATIESIVRRGFPGQMPAFAKRLQQPDLDHLAAYVHSLHK